MSRLTRIGVAVSYLSLAAVPLYGASVNSEQVQDVPARAKDDVNRFTVAAHEIGRLNLQAQELAKAIHGVAASIRTAAASCSPTPIPPLFAEASTSSRKKVSISRSSPAHRRRANAAARPTLFFPRF